MSMSSSSPFSQLLSTNVASSQPLPHIRQHRPISDLSEASYASSDSHMFSLSSHGVNPAVLTAREPQGAVNLSAPTEGLAHEKDDVVQAREGGHPASSPLPCGYDASSRSSSGGSAHTGVDPFQSLLTRPMPLGNELASPRWRDAAVPNRSCFSKRGASTTHPLPHGNVAIPTTTTTAPARALNILAVPSSLPFQHGKALAGTARAPLPQRSSRRSSALARADVLAQARHRRLLPLLGTEDSSGKGLTSTRPCNAGHLRGSHQLSPKGLRGSCTRPDSLSALQAASLPLSLPETSGASFPGAPARSASPSAGSEVTTMNASESGAFPLHASITSLQHQLWRRTAAPFTFASMLCANVTSGDRSDNPKGPAVASARQHPPGMGAPVMMLTTTVATGITEEVIPVTQWQHSLDQERVQGERNKWIATWMIKQLLGSTVRYHHGRAITAAQHLDQAEMEGQSSSGNGGSGGPFAQHMANADGDDDGGGGDGDGAGYLQPLCERAVIAAYLLHSVLEGLPRHQQSLSPYINMLLDFTFVSETSTNRALLGGTVQDETLRAVLQMQRSAPSRDDANVEVSPERSLSASLVRLSKKDQQPSQRRSFSASASASSLSSCDFDKGDLYKLLYPRFTRKTYAAAHFDAARVTVALAHDVRSRELHQRNVPRLLECMHRHWMRWLVRAILRAWRSLCIDRSVQEQRQRARWAQRWTGERVRIALRRWRGYATFRLQVAEADGVAMATLMGKRATIERLETESAVMQASSMRMQEALQRQDEEREALERSIAQREQKYKRLLQQVREMDRVGTLMLRSLLLPDAPPVPEEADALRGFAAAVNSNGGFGGARLSLSSLSVTIDDIASVSSASLDSCDANEIAPHPPHVLVALPTLLRWAKSCVAAVEEDYYDLFPSDDDEDVEDGSDGAASGSTAQRDRRGKRVPGPGQLTKDGGGGRGDRRSQNASPQSLSSLSQGKLLELRKPSSPSLRAKRAAREDRRVSKGLTRGPSSGLGILFRSGAAAAAAATPDAMMSAATETVLLPLHAILLLMRGCSGVQDGGSRRSRDVVSAATANPLSMMALEEAALLAGTAATAPTWDLIRTIELADRAVLLECQAVMRADRKALLKATDGNVEAPDGPGSPAASCNPNTDNASAAASVAGGSIMMRLSPATRDTLHSICRVVVDSYEQLTGTACVVTAEQLFERSRGVVLVLLAALMRYYTNWSTHHSQQQQPPSMRGKQAALPASNAAAHEGEKHSYYEDWSHPPYSHQSWLAQVQRQAQWIALSFSALHDAVRHATRPASILSINERERVSGLIQELSLTEFVDLLSRKPEHTMQSYVDMIGVVESFAPALHLLFHQYALPLSQLRTEAVQPKCSSPTFTNPVSDKELFITGNTLWHLLCFTGLAGKATPPASVWSARGGLHDGSPLKQLASSSPPLPLTLHRPAVFSLIEQVTQGGITSTAAQRRRGSMRRTSSNAHNLLTAASSSSGVGGGIVKKEELFLPRRASATPVVSVSCKGRCIPCYARAIRDDRHVDLRADTGAVCLNYLQFVKVIIRLAHAWQCLQMQTVGTVGESEATVSTDGVCRTTGGLNDSADSPLASRSGIAAANYAALSASQAASPLAAQVRETGGKRRQPNTAGDTDDANAHVQYEAIDYTNQLCPPYFNTFLEGLLLPRLLGANRWIAASRRAFYSKPVLQIFAQHHDALVSVFDMYQRPREARGVRAALPPPFSTMMASRMFTKMVDAERRTKTSLTADGGRGLSHAERASFVYALTTSGSRRASVAGGGRAVANKENADSPKVMSNWHRSFRSKRSHRGSLTTTRLVFDDNSAAPGSAAGSARDVGIVSIMRWEDVQSLAKDLEWYRGMRLSEITLRCCFEYVLADSAREGEVLFFAEFLQLLCAVACYAVPNPLTPLETKLRDFVTARVLVALG